MQDPTFSLRVTALSLEIAEHLPLIIHTEKARALLGPLEGPDQVACLHLALEKVVAAGREAMQEEAVRSYLAHGGAVVLLGPATLSEN